MGITNYQHLIDEEVDANATLPSPETIPVDSKGKAGGKNTDTVTDAIMDTTVFHIEPPFFLEALRDSVYAFSIADRSNSCSC